MTQPTVTEADIRAACEEAGVEYVPDWRVWWLGTLQRLVLALARRIAAERGAVVVGEPAPYRCKHGCERDALMDRAAAAEAENARLREALHCISLGSQNSGTTKEDLGREARAALEESRNVG